ncbi:hypothetical protein Mro03_57780 [Microbispora rosea subsp. rosea]|nr:hypothetical protein Mro03_57780 [Microbispora rosea subsp. rosea]
MPETAVELAAALDLALSVTPAARFSFDGGFTQSSAFAKATGRVLSRGARYYDDFEMDVHPSEDTAGHYVILGNGDLYLNKSRAKALLLEEQSPADASWHALMVAGTAGPSVIHEVVANSTQMHRKGATGHKRRRRDRRRPGGAAPRGDRPSPAVGHDLRDGDRGPARLARERRTQPLPGRRRVVA